MTFWRFLLDQWRTALLFALGITLPLTVFQLAVGFSGLHVPRGDTIYAALLGIVCFCVYAGIEYLVRRPFYREAHARLRQTSPSNSENHSTLHSADSFKQGRTAEQQLFIELLHHYYDVYAHELATLQDQRRFFEVFTLRFAHQMKTPLTVLQMLKQEMESDLTSGSAPSEEWRVKLGAIEDECLQLSQSLDTMLYAARLQAFEFDAHMENLEVLALLREVVNLHKQEWIHQSVFPKLSCLAREIYVQSDRKWLLFMVNQIIRNALQYGQNPKRPSHSFEIRVEQTAHRTTIDFADEGIGIRKADIHRVFDPFFTGENGRSHSRATGMGLYLVREAANHLGHSVTIQSEEGIGTTVTIAIPRPAYHSPVMLPSGPSSSSVPSSAASPSSQSSTQPPRECAAPVDLSNVTKP